MPELSQRALIRHLLRRAGFGASEAELEEYSTLGFDRAVDRLIHYEQVAEDVDIDKLAFDLDLDLTKIEDQRLLWMYRMATTRRPLQEKMTLFWHGHFATANSKVNNVGYMVRQNQFFRDHALGNYREILRGISRDPAMLRWLDSNTNRKRSPNENYARELMELFTLGIGNYSEQDVKEAARAFTGWFVKDDQFYFDAAQHDNGPKTVLGRTGNWNGDDVIDILVGHPATARRLASKLFRFFVYDNPEPDTIGRFAQVYLGSGYDVRALVEAILRSAEFRSERAFHALIKSPMELIIGAVKALGLATLPRDLAAIARRMGQDLYNPPTVKGWDGGPAWITTSTLLERFNLANRLITTRGREGFATLRDELIARRPASAEQVVDYFLQRFLDGDATDHVRRVLAAYLRVNDDGTPLPFSLDARFIDLKVRGLIHLIMSLPGYQLN
ncbi:MAG: DUF1800 domain-containing protein [Chloroflexota bacterium]